MPITYYLDGSNMCEDVGRHHLGFAEGSTKAQPARKGASDSTSSYSGKHVERSKNIKKPEAEPAATAAVPFPTAEPGGQASSSSLKDTSQAQQATPPGRPGFHSPTRRQELQKELPTSLFIPGQTQVKTKQRDSAPLRLLDKKHSASSSKAAKSTAYDTVSANAQQEVEEAVVKASSSIKELNLNPELHRGDSEQNPISGPKEGLKQQQHGVKPDPDVGKSPSPSELSKPQPEAQPAVDEGPRLTPIEKARLRMQGKLLPGPKQEPRPSSLGPNRKGSSEKPEARSKQQSKGMAEKSKLQPSKESVKPSAVGPSKQLNGRGSSEHSKPALSWSSKEEEGRVAVAAQAETQNQLGLKQGDVAQELIEDKKLAAKEYSKPIKAESRSPLLDAVKIESNPALLNLLENDAAHSLDRVGSTADKQGGKKVSRIGGSVALQPHSSLPPRQEFGEFIGTFGARPAKASEQLARSGAFFDNFCPTVAVPLPEVKAEAGDPSPRATNFGNLLSTALGSKSSYSSVRPGQHPSANGLATSKASSSGQELGAVVPATQFAPGLTSPFADLQAGPPGLQGKEKLASRCCLQHE